VSTNKAYLYIKYHKRIHHVTLNIDQNKIKKYLVLIVFVQAIQSS